MFKFFKSRLPRSVEKRPMWLRLEITIDWHSKCNRLYLNITTVSWGCLRIRISECVSEIQIRRRRLEDDRPTMRWLRLVGSLKLQVSFAEYRLFYIYRSLLQKRLIIWRSLLLEDDPTNTIPPDKTVGAVYKPPTTRARCCCRGRQARTWWSEAKRNMKLYQHSEISYPRLWSH